MKAVLGPAGRYRASGRHRRSWVEIELKVVFSFVPILETTAMIASETPAAISPYSIVVAPESSFRNRTRRFFHDGISKAAQAHAWG
jgi:hypothetical protein